jgi:hypothetical protein
VIRRLAALLSRLAFRRTVAAVCAVAFLTVGVAHALGHCDHGAVPAGYELTSGAADEAPEPAKSASVEHCHGCSMVAVMGDAPTLPAGLVGPVFRGVRLDGIRPHPPSAENPPPITAI